jgi:ubiquitin fusion degradation protein 1
MNRPYRQPRVQPQRQQRRVDVENLFIEVYRAYPASIMGRDEIELSNSVILPPSALQKLSLMKNFNDTKNPILFRILNIQLNIYTHCGVFDFTAQEGTCFLPYNMFDKLCLEEGQKVNLRSVVLQPGTFIKLQPHKTDFIKNPNPKTILEYNLRNYFCATEGDTISVKFLDKIYKIDVLECKPEKAIRTLNCDIMVDFAPPKDYKEPEKVPKNPNSNSKIKFNSNEDPKTLTKEQIQKEIVDKKFSGHHFRMDGKEVSYNQAMRIINAKKEQKNNEENYDPRKCRIPSNPRPEFRYVEL